MLQTKGLQEQILDVDTEKKTVKAVWAAMGNIDLDGDVIMPGAFTKTIQERGPQGKNLIWALIDHEADLKHAIGKPSELYEENGKLIAVTKIVDTELGEDIITMYNEGLINQHSIGFSIPKNKSEIRDGVRYIKECVLYEGSAVLWGANPETPTLGVFKGMNAPAQLNASQRLEKMLKAFKHGKFTDETFQLIEIEIKQIQAMIEAESTQPADDAVEPDNEITPEQIKQIFSNFKL